MGCPKWRAPLSEMPSLEPLGLRNSTSRGPRDSERPSVMGVRKFFLIFKMKGYKKNLKKKGEYKKILKILKMKDIY